MKAAIVEARKGVPVQIGKAHRESASLNVLPHRRHRQIPAGEASSPMRISRRWSRPRTSGSASRTGIEYRHIAADDEATSDLAYQRRARGDRGRGPRCRATSTSSLVGTTTPDLIFPNVACLVQEKLEHPAAAPRSASRPRARGSSTASSSRISSSAAGAGASVRSSSAPRRCRASSIGRTARPACCSATAPAR